MTSILTSVNWKWCIGKYTSFNSSPLYRYEQCPTPENYYGQQTIQAFKLDYDRASKSISLQHNEQMKDGIGVEFSKNINLSPRSKAIEVTGWYFCHKDLVNFDWGNLKPGMEIEGQLGLEKKGKFQWIREKEGHIGGINRLWVIRGYFIGPNETNAPPCITVLCAYEDVARFLVDFVHSRLHLHKGWGATMLPGVKVLKFASTPPNDDDLYNSDKSDDPMYFDEESLNATVERGMESNLIRIEVGSANEHSMPTMTSGDLSSWQQKLHRCGVPVEIVRGPEVIGKATIGGLITVGDEVYGLTVGHLFSSSTEHNEEAQQSLDTWQEWLVCGMDFDWALIRIPGLHEEDVKSWENVNLVQTVSGEFRPVLVALEEPSPYTHVIIATPGSTRCLRGVFIGPGAIVNIPESPTPYATWVCRMELPWLIQPGDSGSWVLDAGNGMLMGVLVAGCPELQEAYFIPAHEIFDDIRQHYPDRYPDMPVSLPNCHLLPRTSQIDLKRHIDEYGRIVKSCLNSPQGLEELDNHITKWVDQSETFVDVSSSLYNLRDERSEWKSALSVLKYSNLDKQQNDGFDNSMKHNLRTVFQQSPLRCYNFLNEIFVSGQDLQHIASMKRFWRCLMLGCVSYTSNDRDLSFDTASDYRSAIIRELRLMNITSRDHSGFQSPWEKDSIAKSHWKYSFRHTDSFADHVSEHAIFPWAEHASKHIFPNPSLNKGDRKYLSRTDHLFRIIYSHRTGLPPWDRLTATEVLHTLRGDLQDLNTLLKRGVEISLPETKMPDSQFVSQRLRSDGDIMLFAVKLTEKNNRFLVVLPPPSVGPSKSIQPWPSARDYPAYARSNRHIAFSAWRLPFMLTDKSTPEEECLELLLSTQLNIDIGALKQRWKLDLRDEHSRFYLKEYNKYVDVVIYEGHVEDQSFVSPKMIHGPTGWMMQMMDEASARKHLSPPFSAILYPPIPDEQNIN